MRELKVLTATRENHPIASSFLDPLANSSGTGVAPLASSPTAIPAKLHQYTYGDSDVISSYDIYVSCFLTMMRGKL